MKTPVEKGGPFSTGAAAGRLSCREVRPHGPCLLAVFLLVFLLAAVALLVLALFAVGLLVLILAAVGGIFTVVLRHRMAPPFPLF